MAFKSRIKLEREMNSASSYAVWREAAIAHDKRSGMDQWREDEATPLFDFASIRQRLDEIRKLRAAKDLHGLLFTLNEGLHGNLDGIGSRKLYRQAKFGTKMLISDYLDEVVGALEYIARSRSKAISFEDRLEFFRRASHCYGRSALMFSGGANLAHFHLGVAKALSDESLLPEVISGASGGSLVAAVLGTHRDEQLHSFFEPRNLVMEIKREAGWFSQFFTLSRPRVKVSDLAAMLERLIPDLTFAEAKEESGRSINISVAPFERHQAARLLNATTSPNVFVRSAVMASCAVPGIFPPVMLEAKNQNGERQPYLPQRRWIDGSVSDDLPTKRLSRLYGVNHYIASQTNPIALLIANDPKSRQGLVSTSYNILADTWKAWLKATHPLAEKLVRGSPSVEYLYRTFYSVATQNYAGDITLTPRSRVFNPTRLLTMLPEDEMMKMIVEGQQCTYPKIEMIRNCTKISRTLDEILLPYERRALRLAHPDSGPRLVAGTDVDNA